MQDDFSDLPEDLGAIYGTEKPGTRKIEAADINKERPVLHRDDCPACKGTGRFVAWSGRHVGRCFKCDGRGYLEYRTPRKTRLKAKLANEKRKAARQLEKAQEAVDWCDAHPAERDWLNAGEKRGFDFAVSLKQALIKYGSLTDGQLAAVRKCIARDEERAAERAKVEQDNAVDVGDASPLHKALAACRDSGRKWVYLKIGKYQFNPGKAGTSNESKIWVKVDGQFVGGIEGSTFKPRSQVAPSDVEYIKGVIADPKHAASEYGVKTGICCVCGAELTNEVSVKAGIGPICASRFGW